MNIKAIPRPWYPRKTSHGTRYNPDPFYHSPLWTRTKRAFKLTNTVLHDGRKVSNTLCLEHFKKREIRPGHTIDHIIPISLGGHKTDFSNLQNLCLSCHNRKSADEGNEKRKQFNPK